MIISLNPDWRIRSDDLQWIVERGSHGAKAGYRQWRARGYYSTLVGAVQGFVQSEIRALEGNYPWTVIEPLLGEITALREYVSEAFKDFRFDVSAKPEKNRARRYRRNSREKDAMPSWLTDKQNQEIVWIYEEAARLSALKGVKYHVDHIVPLQGENVCGLHVPWNLRCITAHENLVKGNRLEE